MTTAAARKARGNRPPASCALPTREGRGRIQTFTPGIYSCALRQVNATAVPNLCAAGGLGALAVRYELWWQMRMRIPHEDEDEEGQSVRILILTVSLRIVRPPSVRILILTVSSRLLRLGAVWHSLLSTTRSRFSP